MNASDDAHLFDTLFECHQRLLYAYLLGQTGDRETASDLLQEVFVRVWRNIGKVRAMKPEGQRPWLIAVARNLTIDQRRKIGGREEAELTEIRERGRGPEEIAVEKDQMERLDAAMRNLEPGLRTVLTMSVVGEMTSAEIGDALGRPAGTVRYQIAEARKRLAEEVGL